MKGANILISQYLNILSIFALLNLIKMEMLYIKALHIIFVVTWFAGLFYIVRLFVYHAEAEKKPEPEKTILQNQFKIMEKRLWYGITWPSMIATYIFGFWAAFLEYRLSFPPYLILKLCFVLGLTLYHLRCHRIFVNFVNDIVNQSSLSMRIWNEGATLFLIAIVFTIVVKSTDNWLWGVVGLVILGVAFVLIIRALFKKRENHAGSKV